MGGVIDEDDGREINIQREERNNCVASVSFDIVMYIFDLILSSSRIL